MKKIYVKGNYLVLEAPNGTKQIKPCKDIRVSRINETDKFQYRTEDEEFNQILDWINLSDENGEAFASLEAFEDFIYSNTGNFTKGEVSGPTAETDPEFRSSEASRFQKGDKAKLDEVIEHMEWATEEINNAASQEYVQAQDAQTYTASRQYADSKGSQMLTDSKTYTDAYGASMLNEANSYSDSKGASMLNASKTYTESYASNMLNEAKQYSDSKAAPMANTISNKVDKSTKINGQPLTGDVSLPLITSLSSTDLSVQGTPASGSIAINLKDSGVNTGSYGNVNVNSKGIILSGKRSELFNGSTGSGGNYTVTFTTPYTTVPNIYPCIIGGLNTHILKVTAVSTTGFTISVVNRIDALGVLPAFNAVAGILINVRVDEK